MANTLLLVDDDTRILETAKDILEIEGFLVLTAETGESALEILRSHPCDLMMVDYNLPDTTGVKLAIQAREILPKVTIFLMTGETQVDLGNARTIISATLLKPVDPAKLIELIRRNS